MSKGSRNELQVFRDGLQDMSRRQIKVFRCSSFSKMLPRCGRAAHICGANRNYTGMCLSLAEPDSGSFSKNRVFNHEPQATKKFFDPAIFQKCWRGSGRAALIAARRQRNPRAMLLAHGAGGEKSDSFSRRGEQDRPALLP